MNERCPTCNDYVRDCVCDDEPLDVWLRIPDGEEEAELEANTFRNGEFYRVDWYHTAVGQVTSKTFATYDQARDWLTEEGFEDYTS